jgi:5-formyltetrahydrofolate cyclo-ligase
MSKSDMRVQMARHVSDLAAASRREFDDRIQQRLRRLPEFRAARQVLAYLPLTDEPSLVSLLCEAIAASKRVYVPLVRDNDELHYLRWAPSDGAEAAHDGRWTPSSSEQPHDEPSVVLVPGRAFDRRGRRLGRGKGCYDRSIDALARLGPTVGIAYDAQVVEAVPHERHDRPVQIVVTERETIRPKTKLKVGDTI